MGLQDLTPQLRMRMTRVERLVGAFVLLAALLMGIAFTYYLRETGKQRGWFINKVPYYCYLEDSTGLKTGDPVRLLGRDVGRITQIEACPPDDWFVNNHYNVFVKFDILDPYFGYIWTDSRVRVLSSDFFGARYLEVTRGSAELAFATVIHNPNRPFEETELLNDKDPHYPNPDNRVALKSTKKGVWLFTEETPSIAKDGQQIVRTIAQTLPVLTNQIVTLLASAGEATSNVNVAITQIQPTLQHLEALSARLESEQGAIGRMLLTTNLQLQVETALTHVNDTITNTTTLVRTSEEQLRDLTRRISLTLDNVALITGNLSTQVNANSMILGEISSLIVDADDMVEGLKRHWLLRSAFQAGTNAPIESVVQPVLRPTRSRP